MKKQITQLVDDYDGTLAEETMQFVFDGTAYSIDLSTGNAGAFREEMRPWCEAATEIMRGVTWHKRIRRTPRSASTPRRPKRHTRTPAKVMGNGNGSTNGEGNEGNGDLSNLLTKGDREKIRAWAKGKGHTVADRGRLSADVVKRYNDAHRSKKLASVK